MFILVDYGAFIYTHTQTRHMCRHRVYTASKRAGGCFSDVVRLWLMPRLRVFLFADRHWQDKRLLCGRAELYESCYHGQDSPSGHEDDPQDRHETKHSITPPHSYLSWLGSQGESQCLDPRWQERLPQHNCLNVSFQLVTKSEKKHGLWYYDLIERVTTSRRLNSSFVVKLYSNGSIVLLYK